MEPKTEPEPTFWNRNRTGTDFFQFLETGTEPEPTFWNRNRTGPVFFQFLGTETGTGTVKSHFK